MDGTSPDCTSDEPAELFEWIENEGGPILDDEDHRLIVETIRMDRDLHH